MVLYCLFLLTFTLCVFILFLVWFGLLNGHLFGKELLTRLTIRSVCMCTIFTVFVLRARFRF